MTKLIVFGHSLAHIRQHLFIRELTKHFDSVVAVGPDFWTVGLTQRKVEIVPQGYKFYKLRATYPGDWFNSIFPQLEEVIEKEADKDTWVYSMEEPQVFFNLQLLKLKEKIGFKFAVFTWENITKNYPSIFGKIERDIIDKCDLLICGNQGAKRHYMQKGVPEEKIKVILQVGIDMDLFKPLDMNKEYDVLIGGNKLPQKGVYLAESVCRELGLKVCSFGEGPCPVTIGKNFGYVAHEKLPEIYNKAKIAINYSLDTAQWKEQAPNYLNIESMACGLPVVTSDTEAIKEYLSDCPASFLVKRGNVRDLRNTTAMLNAYNNEDIKKLGLKGREFVKERWSNEVVAKRLIMKLKEVE